MDSTQLGRALCRLQAHTVGVVYRAFLSEECTELQWVRQDAMLPCWTSAWKRCHATLDEYHAGAGEGIPAEPDSITIFDVIPLLFERFILHAVAEGIPAGKKLLMDEGGQYRHRIWHVGFTLGLLLLQAVSSEKPKLIWQRHSDITLWVWRTACTLCGYCAT